MRKLLLGLLLLSGCTSALIKSPHQDIASPYGPRNANDQPGIMAYYSAGAPFVVQARRQDAFKKMFELCAGAYEIVREDESSDGFTPQRNIYFKCVTDSPK